MEKSLPAGLAGKMRVIHTLPPHLERATMEAIHNSLQVSHVWIAKFVKLPKDTVGSFIMTFHTDAVADLLGVEEANPRGEPQQEEDPAGGPINQAEVQPSMPSSPSSHLPSGSAGPSSGHDRAPSQAGTEGSTSQTSRRGKRKKKEQMQDHTHTTVPSSFYLPYRELVHRAALALKTCEAVQYL